MGLSGLVLARAREALSKGAAFLLFLPDSPQTCLDCGVRFIYHEYNAPDVDHHRPVRGPRLRDGLGFLNTIKATKGVVQWRRVRWEASRIQRDHCPKTNFFFPWEMLLFLKRLTGR
jgi:hypothetical protein